MESVGKAFVCGVAVGALLHWRVKTILCDRLEKKKHLKPKEENERIYDCYFFSPHGYWPSQDAPVTTCSSCGVAGCNCLNFQRFISVIKNAKSHLDICVYLITADCFVNEIIRLFKKGLRVRIITDRQMSDEAFGTRIIAFRRLYIPIKVVQGNNDTIMHNKFVVVDKKTLLTGSFNWTRQGTCGNYENGIMTNETNIVKQYLQYFDHLWNTHQ